MDERDLCTVQAPMENILTRLRPRPLLGYTNTHDVDAHFWILNVIAMPSIQANHLTNAAPNVETNHSTDATPNVETYHSTKTTPDVATYCTR